MGQVMAVTYCTRWLRTVDAIDQNVQHLTGPHIGHLLLTEKGLAADTSKEWHHHVVVCHHYSPPLISYFHAVPTW